MDSFLNSARVHFRLFARDSFKKSFGNFSRDSVRIFSIDSTEIPMVSKIKKKNLYKFERVSRISP